MLPVLKNGVHGGCNGHLYNSPPPWLSTSTTSPNTRPFIPCGVRKRDGTKRPCLLKTTTKHTASVVLVLHVFSFFADLSIYRLGALCVGVRS